ncbi:hypothetical protein DASC09_058740 [Saccharomycopsis crataegensis]|uniref:Altered inheritance of mitochondria protein 21 n=1 Tax=Saccharomycopsis crataegensis TaxID=43959 RepID=A0AAV5QVB2_9ASCO|nr:hypothetical protein DASC09_058740 [Saccharomycopsis crataegensis]
MSEESQKKLPPTIPKRPSSSRLTKSASNISDTSSNSRDIVSDKDQTGEDSEGTTTEEPEISENTAVTETSDEVVKNVMEEETGSQDDVVSESKLGSQIEPSQALESDKKEEILPQITEKRHPPVVPKRISRTSTLEFMDSEPTNEEECESSVIKDNEQVVPPIAPKKISRTNSMASSGVSDSLSQEESGSIEESVIEEKKEDVSASMAKRPSIPRRPARPASNTNTPPPIKKKPPVVPKKPSSKILAFQNMLAQQQQEQSNSNPSRFVPEVIRRKSSGISSEEDSESEKKRSNISKNLNGIFGTALPGMAPPGMGFFPEKIPKASSSSSSLVEDNSVSQTPENADDTAKETEPKKLSDIRRGRVKASGRRRLPTAAVKKVETKSQDNNKFSVHVADLWEVVLTEPISNTGNSDDDSSGSPVEEARKIEDEKMIEKDEKEEEPVEKKDALDISVEESEEPIDETDIAESAKTQENQDSIPESETGTKVPIEESVSDIKDSSD